MDFKLNIYIVFILSIFYGCGVYIPIQKTYIFESPEKIVKSKIDNNPPLIDYNCKGSFRKCGYKVLKYYIYQLPKDVCLSTANNYDEIVPYMEKVFFKSQRKEQNKLFIMEITEVGDTIVILNFFPEQLFMEQIYIPIVKILV